MDNAWRQVVAALADEGRLALFGAVVTAAQDSPLRVDVLTTDQRRRLAPLVAAGIVSDDAGALVPRVARFRELLAAASAADPQPPVAGPERFLVAGRLEAMPRRQDDRSEVVRYLAARALPLQEPTDERTLMATLSGLAADPVGLRRAMVDAGLVLRTRDGSSYWRTTVTEHDGTTPGADVGGST